MDRSHLRRHAAVAVAAALAAAVAALLAPAVAGAATRALGAGTATFHLDSGETATIMGTFFEPYPAPPARLSFGDTTATLTLPVSGGTWNTGTSHGTFDLRGGLRYVEPIELISGPPDVTTGRFVQFAASGWHAGVGTSAGLSVVTGGARLNGFFDQQPTGSARIVTVHGKRYVKVTGLALTFNATSVAALTNVFSRAPGPGDPFGSLTLLARLK